MQILQKQFEGRQMRMVELDGQPWFVLADVCAVLEVKNSRNVAARLDEDEKGVRQMDTPSGAQEMTVINESGLYAVILRSDKPQARPFRKWITNEVLPSLRQTGTYTVGQGNAPALISARGVAAALGCSRNSALNRLSHANIRPTHHYFESRAGQAALLYPLHAVQERWPAAEFASEVWQGEAFPGIAPVAQAVGASKGGKIARRHQPRLIPTDTHAEQLARRLLSLEAQKREVLRELAALA